MDLSTNVVYFLYGKFSNNFELRKGKVGHS